MLSGPHVSPSQTQHLVAMQPGDSHHEKHALIVHGAGGCRSAVHCRHCSTIHSSSACLQQSRGQETYAASWSIALSARWAASGPAADWVALSCRSSRNMGRELTYLCRQALIRHAML